MNHSLMLTKSCPFKQGNCQGMSCMAADKHPDVEDYYCSLIEVPIRNEAILESPQIPEGYTIREIKT